MNHAGAAKLPIRILLVEDEPADAELVVDDLRADGLAFVDLRVDTEDGYLQALESFQPDIVLSDLNLPSFDGHRALALLRERDTLLPFIFVSGTIGEDTAVEALRKGATDYILKNNTARLPAAVRRALREALEQRARQNAEQELVRAQRFESLALLAGGISHDLRNLLQPLLVAADMLDTYRADARLANLGNLVRDCVHRGLDMVTSMLTFARGAERNERVHVDKLFEALELLIKSSVPHGVALDIQPAAIDLAFEGNQTELQQTLLNLCLNAFQAMPGGGRLSIAATRMDLSPTFFRGDESGRPGTHVCIRVADTGSGMSAEMLEKLFVPFFTTKRNGTGLGLVSCKRIIDAHGGVMRVESSPGSGTCFALYIPETVHAAQAIDAVHAAGRGECILLVDEEAVQLSLLRSALENAGYVVRSSRSGTEALQSLDENGLPEMVIMDAEMNLLTGARTLAALLDRHYHGAVLLMVRPNARPGLDALPPIERLAMVDKPVERSVLLRTVRNLLDDGSMQPQLKSA